jgi:hypothetical protein
VKIIDGKFIVGDLRFFIHESHEFSRMGSAFAGEFYNQFNSWLFAEFELIAPALSLFGPTICCSTSCPPRHSVVVQICSVYEERSAEEDLGGQRQRSEVLFSIHCGRTYGATDRLSDPENGNKKIETKR